MGRGRVRLTGRAGMRYITDRPTEQCTLNHTLEEWGEKWIWYHLDLAERDDLDWLADAFRNGTSLFICDGSYQPDLCRYLGAATWIIELTATKRRVRGVL